MNVKMLKSNNIFRKTYKIKSISMFFPIKVNFLINPVFASLSV